MNIDCKKHLRKNSLFFKLLASNVSRYSNANIGATCLSKPLVRFDKLYINYNSHCFDNATIHSGA